MKALVLHDRLSPEAGPEARDVLDQVAAVTAALEVAGHEVAVDEVDGDLASLRRRLELARPDIVFNLVESLEGHDQLIHVVPSLLATLGIRHTGSPAETLLLTSHKLLAKGLLRRAGLPTPDWLTGDPGMGGLARGSSRWDHEQWIVKSVWEHASLGLDDGAVLQAGATAVRRALAGRAALPGAPWFAEAYVDGREFNLALLEGPQDVELLPPAEMLFTDYPLHKPRIVGYAAKWEPGSFEYEHTVRSFASGPADRPLLARLARLARDCWSLFGLRGWARVDLRVDASGRPWILEVNANPCLAPDAGFAAALAEAEITFEVAVARILAAAAPPAGVAPAARGR